MIAKAEILAAATSSDFLPTTIEKDYVLGWVLAAISSNPALKEWVFKGGTCLKKCYFETYRFSEDLDFTVPPNVPYDAKSIEQRLREVADWVSDRAGINFPIDGLQLTESVNRRGRQTYEARLTFLGPLGLPRAERQRIKFDLTQDESIRDDPRSQAVFHAYSDDLPGPPLIRCYSLDELIAEKCRALYERSGRARDVYDVVNVGRNYLPEVRLGPFRRLIEEKFAYKGLEQPTAEMILSRVEASVLRVDWENSLRHQLPLLPPVETFLEELGRVLRVLLGTESAPELSPVAGKGPETTLPRPRFAGALPEHRIGAGRPVRGGRVFGSQMDRVRFAARNQLLVQMRYHGVTRVVEPYSLRQASTGNLLLYVYEVRRGMGQGGGIKAFKVAELDSVEITEQSFRPKYRVEL